MIKPARPPARLTASATLKLPRWGLFGLCLLYILPGLIGRDPWKSEDATGFGIMWTMANGSLHDWLIPNLAGLPVIDNGPLMFWVGALCIKLAGLFGDHWIEPDMAARLATVLFFLLTSTALWYATFLLGRRPAAQPLALAFGGQPEPRDYGRALADGALLILLGTIGMLTRSHESSSDVAMLAMLALALYAMARSLEQPRVGALWLAAALAGLGLSRGPVLAGLVALLWIVLLATRHDWRAARLPFVLICVPLTAVGLALWPLLAWWLMPDAAAHFDARASARLADLGSGTTTLLYFARMLPWFAWLAWPIAVWCLWSWRRQIGAAHIVLPGGFVVVGLLLAVSTHTTSDGVALAFLPGLVVLAAFGMPTMKRGAANAIDWFSLMIYSGAALLIWLGWIAKMTGVPHKIALNFARQTPGFTPEFIPVAFVIALLASIAWIALVWWRITTHPKVLWRGVVLTAGGVTLSWMLLMTLWLPSINYSKTYRDVALRLDQALPPTRACVQTDGLGTAQRASFAYFADVRFAPVGLDGSQPACPWLLRQDSRKQPHADALPDGQWRQVWEGRRASDRDERFRLYRRAD